MKLNARPLSQGVAGWYYAAHIPDENGAPRRRMKKNLVKDWMATRPLAVNPDTTLTEADVTMEARRIRRLVVVEDGVVVGVVSEGDLREARARYAADPQAREPTVRELMTPDPITISGSISIALAAQTMLQAKISGLPVVDDQGRLIGVLSESDVFRYVIEMSRGE